MGTHPGRVRAPMSFPAAVLRRARTHRLEPGRAGLAARAAVAAALAWAAVRPFGGIADQYPYYAPMGAVIAVTGSVAVSFTASVRAVLAIMLGSSIALILAMTPLGEPLSLALAVGIGTLLAGWRPIRPMASWVPIACIFVLEVGGETPWEFATAYFALTGLGALVGTGVDLMYPTLPWQQTDARLTELRERLAGELDQMADALGAEGPPDPEVWVRTRPPVVAHSVEVDHTVDETAAYRKANWRARRWWYVPEAQQRRAETLKQLALLVEDLRTLLESHEHRDAGTAVLGSGLRWPAATAMRAVADVLRTAADADEDDCSDEHRDALQRAVEAVHALEEEVRRRRADGEADLFAASSIVTTLWRVVSTLTPRPLRGELLEGW